MEFSRLKKALNQEY